MHRMQKSGMIKLITQDERNMHSKGGGLLAAIMYTTLGVFWQLALHDAFFYHQPAPWVHLVGDIGYGVASVAIYYAGLGAWCIPLWFFYRTARLLDMLGTPYWTMSRWSVAILHAFLACIALTLCALCLPKLDVMAVPAGGYIGFYCAHALLKGFEKTGTLIFLIGSALACLHILIVRAQWYQSLVGDVRAQDIGRMIAVGISYGFAWGKTGFFSACSWLLQSLRLLMTSGAREPHMVLADSDASLGKHPGCAQAVDTSFETACARQNSQSTPDRVATSGLPPWLRNDHTTRKTSDASDSVAASKPLVSDHATQLSSLSTGKSTDSRTNKRIEPSFPKHVAKQNTRADALDASVSPPATKPPQSAVLPDPSGGSSVKPVLLANKRDETSNGPHATSSQTAGIPSAHRKHNFAQMAREFVPNGGALDAVSSASNHGALPPLELLHQAITQDTVREDPARIEMLRSGLESKLADFSVQVKVVNVQVGPVITRYEMELAPGIKASKVTALAKDIARSLSVPSVRVLEVIPGKSVIGIEIPNHKRMMVGLDSIFKADAFTAASSPLALGLGVDISGQAVVVDLCKMPHLLVAGTTGSGKSVGLNALLLSLLFRTKPEDLRMILIDPKMLEFAVYEGIPHLLTPVVTDMKDAASALSWCVAEMERRYKTMSELGVRNISGYNKRVAEMKPQDLGDHKHMPYIVVMADEFADMMMMVGKKVEQLIARLAQKARAAGIHLILATQRPSVDVITGLIKANIPTRLAFQVSSKIDSRTIIDQQGAEMLLGAGDMLYLAPGSCVPTRCHGAFVADETIADVVQHLRQSGPPDYIEEILAPEPFSQQLAFGGEGANDGQKTDESLYNEAVHWVCQTRKASISAVQRKLRIGYNRAANIIDKMEEQGVVSAADGSGGRTVLAPAIHADE